MNTLRFTRLGRCEELRFRFRPLPLVWRAMTYLSVALVLFPPLAQAADVVGNPQIAAGAATFRQNGNVRTIEQHTGAAVINWQDFGVRAGDITRFVQPSVNSAVLNRVLGANPSLIQGQLQANGSVYLINPNGIVVGPQGRIDVGAFFVSTLNVSNDEFLKGGSLLFRGDSKAGIQNLGTINARDGDVMLIAYTVKNAGEVNAPNGVAGLAAGSEVLLTHSGDQRIVVKSGVKAGGLERGVENSGVVAAAQAELKAAGGSIYELAVNQSGVVRATGVEERNGRVLLTADAGTVRVSGEISARNANGSGGEILVGGDYQGKNTAVPNAATTVLTETAKLDASAASASGNGGKVVVWADGATQFKGGITARAGDAGGDGGLVEVSGKRFLDFLGTVDNSAPRGRRGSLLLDPDAIIISTAASQDLFQQGGFVQAQALPSFLNNATLSALLDTTDVEIRTGDLVGGPAGYNGISVNADVSWTTASKLTLVSGDTIAINANLSGGTGSGLDLQAGTRSVADGSVGTISLAADKVITVGSLTLGKSSLAAPGGTDVGTVNLAGTVNASTVTLSRTAGGFAGDVLVNNANNTIGTLTGDGAVGAIGGSLKVRDSAGGLTVSGDLSGVAGAVEIITSGNLTLDTGATVKNTGASDLVLASRGGSFINNAGATAVDASGSGRYLIYSDAPATTTKGGLTGATTYNKTFDANAPASITPTGDRFLYSLAPTLTFTADNASKTYGAANPTLNYTVSGLQSGDTLGAAISGTPTLATTATVGTGAGTVPLTVANGSLSLSDMGYGLTLAPGTLTINQAPLTVTANNASKTYGAVNPAFSAAFSGLVNGDLSSVVSGLALGTTALTGSGVGGYSITGSAASAANYAITYAPGTLTVNAAPLTITSDNASRTYGAANPTFSASFSGLVNSDLSSVVSGLALGTTATIGSGVGGYPITGSGASAANYAITYAPGTLTVNQAPLTITANNASRLFGAADPTFTALFSGLVNGDNSSVVSGLSLATTATAASAAGAYPITPSGASAANYTITFAPGTLTIANAILTITANDFSRTYGAANPAFTASYAGFIGGDTAAVVSGLQFNTSATVGSSVGTFAITPFGATAPNYGINFAPGTLTINAADLTIRADDASRTYGAANPALTATFTGLVAGDTAANISGLSLSTASSAASGIGGYTITTAGGVNANYNITRQNGTLTVDRAPLTITADNQAKTYGAANPTLTASYSGLVNGENSSVVSGLALNTTAASGSGVGSYPITGSGASAANYSLTYASGALTVNPASLTITADNASKTYGAANPAFSAAFSGLVNGDLSSVVTGLGFTTPATTASGAGNYAVTPGSASAANYSLTYAPGTLTVNKAALTITPDNASKTYGAANPTLTASFSGLVNSDLSSVVSGLALNTTALTGSGVGGYPITASSGSAANYSLTYAPGTLTINQAPLTITADNATRTYGSANPTLTASFSGLVNGDLSSVVGGLALGTPATTGSGVGSYPITGSGASAANYDITLTPGALTVNPATLTVRADNQSRTYGDANPTLTGTLTGFVLGENASVLTTAPIYSTAAGLTTGVGSHAITPSGAGAANYNFSYQNGALTVNPAILSVRADNQVRVYGDANPTLTTTVTGLKNGDSASGKFFVSAFGSFGSATAPVGNYTILLQGLDVPNDNYTTFFANGTETITARPLTIRTDNLSREYGLANPAFTATFTGLAAHDTAAVIPNLGFTTLATVNSPVQTLGVTPTSGNNANYAITRLPGQLTITPAPLTIGAGSHFRDYGDANPTFTPSIATGELRAGDTVASVNLRIATTAAQTSPVGTYDLTAALSSLNYTINNPLAGSLQILPAILDVTIGNVNRFYGEANPVNLPVSATGLKLGQSVGSIVSVVNPAAANQTVGTYSLVASSLSGNYQIRSVTGGGVQVNPRPITVSADSHARLFGDANPTFTTTLGGMGLASFDSADVLIGTVDTTAFTTRESAPGLYVIRPSLVANPNYQATAQTGVLTVNQRPIEITMHNLAKFYYDPNPEIAFTIGGAGLAPFHNASAVLGFLGSLPAQSANVGHYPYFPRVLDNRNYAITLTPGYLSIIPRAVEITVNSFDLAQGTAVPAFTAQFSGLPAGVSFADAFPGLTFKTSATDTIPTVKPVPTLPVFTPPAPPAPVVVTTTTVDASGNVSVTFPIIPIQITVPEPPPAGSFTILLPSTQSLGTETVSRQVLTVDGYNANPNYAVTKVNNGSLTIRTPRPETELQRQTRLAREGNETKITVVGLDEHLAAQATVKLSEPLTSPKYSTLMTQAAEDYRAYLEKSGQGELLKRYFGGGIEAFLASYAGDTDRKAGMLAALSARVQSYALLPADQQPPELAELIQSVTTRAKAFVRDEAKEAVRQHDEWVAWKTDPNRVESMTVLYGDDTPDFTAKARQGRAEEALAITAGAVAVTGAAAVGIAAAVTAGGLAATYLASAATFVALGAAVVSTAFIAPVAAVVMVVVGSAVRLAQVLNEDERVAANAQARVTAKMENPPVDFSGKDGADLFTMSFASLMQNSGF